MPKNRNYSEFVQNIQELVEYPGTALLRNSYPIDIKLNSSYNIVEK